MTGLGEAEPQHVTFILVAEACSIAMHGDTLAVGTACGTIELLSYSMRVARLFSASVVRAVGQASLVTAAKAFASRLMVSTSSLPRIRTNGCLCSGCLTVVS